MKMESTTLHYSELNSFGVFGWLIVQNKTFNVVTSLQDILIFLMFYRSND